MVSNQMKKISKIENNKAIIYKAYRNVACMLSVSKQEALLQHIGESLGLLTDILGFDLSSLTITCEGSLIKMINSGTYPINALLYSWLDDEDKALCKNTGIEEEPKGTKNDLAAALIHLLLAGRWIEDRKEPLKKFLHQYTEARTEQELYKRTTNLNLNNFSNTIFESLNISGLPKILRDRMRLSPIGHRAVRALLTLSELDNAFEKGIREHFSDDAIYIELFPMNKSPPFSLTKQIHSYLYQYRREDYNGLVDNKQIVHNLLNVKEQVRISGLDLKWIKTNILSDLLDD